MPVRIELLSGLRAQQGDRVITRFRSQKTGALLAYLAYYPQRIHSREVLIDLLWPECELESGRSRLSMALSSLRHQLEPPGVPTGTVIIADRASVRINPAAIVTDVAEFEAALDAAERAQSSTEREQFFVRAVQHYRGPLLPGYYEEWISPEQERLAERCLQALGRLIDAAERAGDLGRALDYAHQAAGADPLREETHRALMLLYAAAGQPSAALQQYQRLERILREELGQEPSAATQQLAHSIQSPSVGATLGAAPREPQAPLSRTHDWRAPTPAPRSADPAIPTGTVTFLLTDIEGSATRWERAGDVFKAALASHHAVLRRSFRQHGGHEVQDVGDAFIVAFARAGDALACAVAGQRALASEAGPEAVGAPRVRMALHTGDVEWGEGKYRGPVLPHGSRIVVAAHSGQILCSESTAALLRRREIADMEPVMELVELGIYRLPGATTSERLFEVRYPDRVAREFPPLRAEPGDVGNLPVQLTRFFGRESELARLRVMLLAEEMRLMTLTGPGGSGKTRLALQVAEHLTDAWRGAVWFVPLADLSEAALILDAVRDALGLPRSPDMGPQEQVVDVLSRRPALLVLDNFEHLVTEGASIVLRLLEQVLSLTCLVTSRQRLGLEGEREFPVSPLPTPSGPVDPERLMLNESIRLFVDRAQAVRPDFQITPANAEALAELCRRLEGIPLALELAAARVQVLTPGQMVEQLAQRFDLLVNRRRNSVARHRTLRAAIDWSYRLLTPELQAFFTRLSVFRGGWLLPAAEASWGWRFPTLGAGLPGAPSAPTAPRTRGDDAAAPMQNQEVLDSLAQLQECSLVVAEESAAGMRFRMLETLREYAVERLVPDARAALERWHGEYYLTMAEAAAAKERQQQDRSRSLQSLEAERENLRAALEWALAHEPVLALQATVALQSYWRIQGHLTEGSRALERALERAVDAPQDLRTRGSFHAGQLAHLLGDYGRARTRLEQALAGFRERQNPSLIALALLDLSAVALHQGEGGTARTLAEEGLQICRASGAQQRMAYALHCVASAAAFQGDTVTARAHFDESLAISRQQGNAFMTHATLNNMGIAAYDAGDYATARTLLEESVKARGAAETRPLPRITLGLVACRQGEYDEAQSLLAESLRISRQRGEKKLIAECLEGLAEVADARSRWERAIRLMGAASAVRQAIGCPVSPSRRSEYQSRITALGAALGETVFDAAWKAGQALTWQHAAAEALDEPASCQTELQAPKLPTISGDDWRGFG